MFALAMANNEEFGFRTHPQQQETLLVRGMIVVKELNREIVIKNGLRLFK